MNVMENSKNQPEWSKVAEVELIYKTKVKASERPVIKSADDACRLLLEIWDLNRIEFQEEFKVLFLNRANKVIGVYHVSSGGITGTVADPRIILAAALNSLSVGLIISHNHPSNNLQPSKADIELTQKIKTGANLFDIKLLDHIIMTSDSFYSFANEGLI
jgi:DNA repair protein RadC